MAKEPRSASESGMCQTHDTPLSDNRKLQGDDVRGRVLTVRVLLKVGATECPFVYKQLSVFDFFIFKIINDIYTERFKAGTNAGPLVTFVQVIGFFLKLAQLISSDNVVMNRNIFWNDTGSKSLLTCTCAIL